MGLDIAIYPDDDCEGTEIVSYRLGNITAISELRSEIENLDIKLSIIPNLILYSDSHTGDLIDFVLLSDLKDELMIMSQCPVTIELKQFIQTMLSAVSYAQKCERPIVFI